MTDLSETMNPFEYDILVMVSTDAVMWMLRNGIREEVAAKYHPIATAGAIGELARQHFRSATVEPSADVRQIANTWRQVYVALAEQGFTEYQALTLIGHMIAAAGKNGSAE